MIPPLILSGAISFFANLAIGFFVYFKNPRNKTNILFVLFSLTVSGWSAGSFLENIIPNKEVALAVLRFNYLFGIWLSPIYLHFIYSFVPISNRRQKILRIAYLASALLSASSYSPLFIKSLRLLQTEPYPFFISSPGPIYYLFFLFFCVTVCEVLRTFLSEMKRNVGLRRLQFKYLAAANAIAIAAGLEYFSRVFGLLKSPPWDDYILVFYLLTLAYAIIRYQLLDIQIVIRRSLVYSLLVTLLSVGYFGLIYGIEQLFRVTFQYRSIWISVTSFAVMALMFQPLKIGIQRFVDWLIFRMPQEELVRRMERLEQETRQTEKLKAVATLAAGLSHELKNPLQFIQTYAEFLPERYDDPEFRRKCSEGMRTEIARITDLLNQLMEFAKPKPPSLRSVEPHKILDSTLDLMNNEFAKRDVDLEKRYGANGVQIQADPDQLRQVILNLVLNALDAIGQKGRVTVTTSQQDGWFTVEVADTGPGIDPKILPRLFEPFNTNKPTGTGLGLSLVHSIIREHRGEISAWSQPGQGTRFTVKLPME